MVTALYGDVDVEVRRDVVADECPRWAGATRQVDGVDADAHAGAMVTDLAKRERKVASSIAVSPPRPPRCRARGRRSRRRSRSTTRHGRRARFAGQVQLAVLGAGRHDDGLRPVDRARAVGDGLDGAGEVDLDDVVGDEFGAEAFGLGPHVVHQLRAHDAVAEAGEVLHLGRLHQCAAGGDRAFEDQRLQRGAGGVEGGGVSGGAGTDDDDVAYVRRRAPVWERPALWTQTNSTEGLSDIRSLSCLTTTSGTNDISTRWCQPPLI